MTTTTGTQMIRAYLPDVFIFDAWECDPDLSDLWEKIVALPRVRRGGGTGRWVDLTPGEAKSIRAEAEYRAQYWLTDDYGVEGVTSAERTAGRAAQRVYLALKAALSEERDCVDCGHPLTSQAHAEACP